MKIVVLDGYCLNPGDLSWNELREAGEVEVYDRTPSEELLNRADGAEILLTNKTILNADSLDKLPSLKYIGVLATGYNVVDTVYAKKKGIVVTNIPAYSTMSVAQMVFAHLLNITNSVAHYAQQSATGVWSRCIDFSYTDTRLIELAGKTMGIVGLGATGMATAHIALAMGMQVIAFTSKTVLPEGIHSVDKATLLRQSDVLSLHCPLCDETKHFINTETLAQMKKSAILINTGRGPLVDEQALAQALNNGNIYAAGIDVLAEEPSRVDNPLLKAKNCHITPHIAWATSEARQRLMKIAVENVKAFIKGEKLNTV